MVSIRQEKERTNKRERKRILKKEREKVQQRKRASKKDTSQDIYESIALNLCMTDKGLQEKMVSIRQEKERASKRERKIILKREKEKERESE